MGETSKIRNHVLKYCKGRGVDLGCGDEKIKPDSIGVDIRKTPVTDVVSDISFALPFKNEEFDYVYSSHCLEHLDADTNQILREWLRILKIGGFLILYLPHIDYYLENNPEHKKEFRTEDIILELKKINNTELIESLLDVNSKDRYSFLIVARKTK